MLWFYTHLSVFSDTRFNNSASKLLAKGNYIGSVVKKFRD